ncbi:hypothetical protein CBM2586_B40039 [Cupriavidus phytorum]|uniref:Uncharacterized protein n=1 Tax=Cupriavidus taiwanensis TaxID=164546 RepID=A0A975XJR3_9BURK|nr:hypothetical protein CBM2586_B40039 [Cupriavidus taiwanensis]
MLPFAQHTEGLRDATGNRSPCLESVATMVARNARRSEKDVRATQRNMPAAECGFPTH